VGAEECVAVVGDQTSSFKNAPPAAATCAPEASFANAAEMRAIIEAEITAIGKAVEAPVVDGAAAAGALTSAKIVRSCAPDRSLLGEHAHDASSGYLNTVTSSYTRIDLDASGAPTDDGNATTFGTGRSLQPVVCGLGELPDACRAQGDYSKNSALVGQQCFLPPPSFAENEGECSYVALHVCWRCCLAASGLDLALFDWLATRWLTCCAD
jgi:hypothetical protein